VRSVYCHKKRSYDDEKRGAEASTGAIYLRQGGYAFIGFSLSVCRQAGLCKNCSNDFHKSWKKVGTLAREVHFYGEVVEECLKGVRFLRHDVLDCETMGVMSSLLKFSMYAVVVDAR